MKIIDLLNKIANGKDVPKKIKYRNKIFIYDKDNQCYVVENYNEYNDLYMSLSNHKGTDLNYEVEIIEEEKKIPEKLDLAWQNAFDEQVQQDCIKMICENINSIIDYLKSKGE